MLVEASQRLPEAPERPGLTSEKPEPASGRPQPASEEPQEGVGTDLRTDRRMYRLPLYSIGLHPLRFPLGLLPKKQAETDT